VSPILAASLVGIVVFCGIVFVMLSRGKKAEEAATPQANRRKEPRIPVASEFDIFWQDSDASQQSTRARGIEMSEHGVSIRSAKPIQCNSVIQVRGRQVQYHGRGRVCHCSKKGLTYIIGVQLENSYAQAQSSY
jgi:hypothetical protein